MTTDKSWENILQHRRLVNIKDSTGKVIQRLNTSEIEEYFNAAKSWAKEIGYYVDTPASKWLGYQYIDLILNKTIHASKSLFKEAELWKWRLDNQNTPEWPYYFNEDEAFKFVKIHEQNINLQSGDGTLNKLILQPHQHLRYAGIVGWRNKTGQIPPQELFILEGRGGGKTLMSVLLSNYLMAYHTNNRSFQSKFFAGTYSASREILGQTSPYINDAEPDYKNRFTTTTTSIKLNDKFERVVKKNGKITKIKPYKGRKSFLSITSSSESHGLKVPVIIIDEVHTLAGDPKFVRAINTLLNSQVKLSQKLVIYTSTRNDVYSQTLENYITKRLYWQDNFRNDKSKLNVFTYIYQVEDGDDLTDIRYWIKAMPNIFCMPGILDIMDKFLDFSEDMDSLDSRAFFTQHFNMSDMVEKGVYLTDINIRENNKTYTVANLKGKEAYLGIDLAMGGDDFTGVYWIVPEVKNGKRTMYIGGKAFTTINNFVNKEKILLYYPGLHRWIKDETLITELNHDPNGRKLERYLIELRDFFNLKVVAYDIAHSKTKIPIFKEIMGEIPLKSIKQIKYEMTEPILALQQDFRDCIVNFNNDSLLTYFLRNGEMVKEGQWCSLTKVTRDGQTDDNKIDGLVAVTVAYEPFITDGGWRGLEGDIVAETDEIDINKMNENLDEILAMF